MGAGGWGLDVHRLSYNWLVIWVSPSFLMVVVMVVVMALVVLVMVVSGLGGVAVQTHNTY